MPFKSKSQERWMFAAEKRGDVKPGTAKNWAHETPDFSNLPDHVHHSMPPANPARTVPPPYKAEREGPNTKYGSPTAHKDPPGMHPDALVPGFGENDKVDKFAKLRGVL